MVTKGKTLVTKGKTLVTEGKTLVTKGKILVTKRKTLVTEGKTLITKRIKRLGETQKLPQGLELWARSARLLWLTIYFRKEKGIL